MLLQGLVLRNQLFPLLLSHDFPRTPLPNLLPKPPQHILPLLPCTLHKLAHNLPLFLYHISQLQLGMSQF
jgi:hypothetical protein